MSLRRVAGSATAAAALVLMPTAAFATTYDEPDGDVTVTDATPAPGEAFEVVVDGPEGTEQITLTVSSDDVPDSAISIAGTQSLTKPANAQGDATFTVTLAAPGEFALVATDEDGETISSATVVVAAAAGDTDDADTDADDTAAGGGTLPDTGAPVAPIAAGAAALLVAGGGAMLFARRRQAQLG